MPYLWVIAAPAVLIGLGLLLAHLYKAHDRKKNMYVGFGWTLSFRDGKVLVTALQPNGPAGRAGVKVGAELHRINGDVLGFADAAAFARYFRKMSRPEIGEIGRFILVCQKRLIELSLAAELVRKPPVPPPTRDLRRTMGDPYIRQGGMASRHVGGKVVIVALTQIRTDEIMQL